LRKAGGVVEKYTKKGKVALLKGGNRFSQVDHAARGSTILETEEQGRALKKRSVYLLLRKDDR